MTTLALEITESFCGCCGDTAGYGEQEWCTNCQPHVEAADPHVPPWLRTFEAVTGSPCPWRV